MQTLTKITSVIVLVVSLLQAHLHATEDLVSRVTSYWDHNGSTMGLVVDGNKRTFVYIKPRLSLQGLVRPGTVLFSGVSNQLKYSGNARHFLPGSAPIEYTVSGPIQKDGSRVILNGNASIRNPDGSIKTIINDTLIFDLISSVTSEEVQAQITPREQPSFATRTSNPAIYDKEKFRSAVLRNDLPTVAHYARSEYIDEPFVDHPGETQAFPPVVHACDRGYTKLVIFLAEHGANMKWEYRGITLALLAEKAGYHDTAEAATRYGSESASATIQNHVVRSFGIGTAIGAAIFGQAGGGGGGGSRTCPNCNGRGVVYAGGQAQMCIRCNGTGHVSD